MSNLTSIDKIILPDNRIRRKFSEKDIRELANDIETNGLYHAIVTRFDSEARKNYLVAGERRYRAIQLLVTEKRPFKYGDITLNIPNEQGVGQWNCPYNAIWDLTPAEAAEIELHENLLRQDLSWQEVVEARSRLHRLRMAEAEAKAIAENEEPHWTVKDTAKELSEKSNIHPAAAHRAISSSLAVVDYLDDPRLKNAKSEQEALNILMRDTEALFSAEILKQDKGAKTLSRHKLIHGDFRKMADTMSPKGYFDLIICDPPYGIRADHFGDASHVRHTYSDTPEHAKWLIWDILSAGAKHLTADEAHLFMFTDIDMFENIRELSRDAGWDPFRTPLIWHHPAKGHIPWGPYNFRREYELILYARRGGKNLSQTVKDVIIQSSERDKGDLAHAARKPPELLKQLIKLSCLPGSRVLDPCCGTGSIFEAADECGVEAWGVEIDENSYKIALMAAHKETS